jgi:hypothetical protein
VGLSKKPAACCGHDHFVQFCSGCAGSKSISLQHHLAGLELPAALDLPSVYEVMNICTTAFSSAGVRAHACVGCLNLISRSAVHSAYGHRQLLKRYVVNVHVCAVQSKQHLATQGCQYVSVGWSVLC